MAPEEVVWELLHPSGDRSRREVAVAELDLRPVAMLRAVAESLESDPFRARALSEGEVEDDGASAVAAHKCEPEVRTYLFRLTFDRPVGDELASAVEACTGSCRFIIRDAYNDLVSSGAAVPDRLRTFISSLEGSE